MVPAPLRRDEYPAESTISRQKLVEKWGAHRLEAVAQTYNSVGQHYRSLRRRPPWYETNESDFQVLEAENPSNQH